MRVMVVRDNTGIPGVSGNRHRLAWPPRGRAADARAANPPSLWCTCAQALMSTQTKFHHLYNSGRWRKLAAHQLRLTPLCEYCTRRGQVVPASVADHVKPHNGNTNAFWLGKLQSLCASCHDRHKRAEESRGYTDHVGLDGWPTDPRHPVNRPRGSAIRGERKIFSS